MSEKITFRELIESIAEETNNSKQFTHDFLKDFVDVINNGLEQDGTVNIAGFGKFKLRRMDERDGYNPQTGEKIKIPAHNKIVFKPYKDLRELVNAPYAHLESELIEEESEHKDTDVQDDFVPPAPPSPQESVQDDEDQEVDTETGEDSPFELEEQTDHDDPAISEEKEQDESDINGDIVEFKADRESLAPREENQANLEDFIGASEQPEEETDAPEAENLSEEEQELADSLFDEDVTDSLEEDLKENDDNDKESDDHLANFTASLDTDEKTSKEESKSEMEQSIENEDDKSNAEEADDTALNEDSDVEATRDKAENLVSDSEEILESIENEKKKEPANPSLKTYDNNRKRTSALPVIAAAALVLIVLTGGAWYMGFFSQGGNQPKAANNSTISAAADAGTQKGEKPSEAKNGSEQKQQTDNNRQNQPQQASAAGISTTEEANDNVGLEIQKGQTLWSIAEEKYGNPRLWPWIYGNNKSLKDPDLIIAGSSLSVPLPSGPQNTLDATDSLGVAKGFLATYRWYKDIQSGEARDHLWAAKSYHNNIRNITNIQIDKADLVYANQAR